MKRTLPMVLLLSLLGFLNIYAQAPSEPLLFSFTTAKAVGKMVYPSLVKDGECTAKVDAGDGSIVPYQITSFASLKVKGPHIKFYCDKPKNIKELNLNLSQVTAADFSGLTGCNSIRIDVNEIKAEAMAQLVASLPTVSTGKLLVKAFSNSRDKNEVYTSHVKIARSKGWEVYGYSGHASQCEVYEGEKDPNGGEEPIHEQLAATLKSNGSMIILKVKGDGDLAYKVTGETKQKLSQGANMLSNITDKEVTLYGDFTEIVCFQSDLVELELKNIPHLTYLNCCANNLSAEAMRTLIKSLPSNSNIEKRFIPFDSKNEYEHNTLTANMVTEAITKNWKVLDWNAGQPTAYKALIPSIVISTLKQKGDLVELRLESNDEATIDLGDGNRIKASAIEPIYELQGNYIHIYGDITSAIIANVGANAIDCTQAKNLKSLDCSKNILDDTAFAQLAETLPYRPKTRVGRLIVLHKNHPAEKNKVSETNVATFKAKNWGVWVNVGAETDVYEEFEGEAITPKVPMAARMQTTLAKGSKLKIYAEGLTDLWADMGNGKFTKMSHAGGVHTLQVEGSYIALYGDLTWLSVQEAALSSFELLYAPHLRSLYINKNALTSLEVSQAPALEWLNCADNDISGVQMDKLVVSLVDASSRKKKAQLYIVDSTTATSLDNKATPEQIAIAIKKGWELRDFNGGASEKPIYTHLDTCTDKQPQIYPVPTHNTLYIERGAPHSTLSIYTLEGIQTLSMQTDDMGNARIDTSLLPLGQYILTLEGRAYRIYIK